MRNIDISKLPKRASAAFGKVRLDFTDLITGKVIDRVEGKNMVFTDALFSNGWINAVSSAFLVLTDNADPIDPDMPFVLGEIIGYGIPSSDGLGLYRGAYNPANQKLAEATLEKISWKFQYDFTAPQAIGTIRTIGLTNQFSYLQRIPFDGFPAKIYSTNFANVTNDGRYSYVCSTSGIVTKYDNLLGTASTIDVSATVGSTGSKAVGYAPATGKYYIHNGDAKTLYEFADNTFGTLVATYSLSNLTAYGLAFYIYGDNMFVLSNGRNIYVSDYVNNTSHITKTVTDNVINGANYQLNCSTCAYGKYIVSLGWLSGSYYAGAIFDMSKQEFVGYKYAGNGAYPVVFHPFSEHILPCYSYNNNLSHNCAIAAKLLDEPKTKTNSTGMTATYELEVYW